MAMPSAVPSAASTASSVPLPISAVGRTMTSTPRKPIRVAVQRRQRTVSPRKRTAKTMMKSGVVKPSATTLASGRCCRA